MKREYIKDGLYGGFTELIKNDRLYYHSIVSREYSKFTEQGQVELIKWLEMQAKEIYRHEEEMLNERAKQLVLKELKK